MGRRYDNSPHPCDWTNKKLMAEARKFANLENFSGSCGYRSDMVLADFPADNGPTLREHTRIYRNSWLNPILDEIEKRFVKA